MSKKKSADSTSSEGQISLFGTREIPDPFRKAIQVVHSKPKSPLSLVQRKLGNAWIKHAMEASPTEEGWWELGIKDLAISIGFDSNNRQYLKESAEALMRIIFEWDVLAPVNKRVSWKASVLFPEIEIDREVIRYQISNQMRDRMMNPDMYALIDMNIVRKFRRASSLAIWEFCVRFEKIGRTAEVEWEKFRDMILGESADGKTYQEYKYFKSKVLLLAIAEINSESNHLIAMSENKLGRRVVSIQFEIKKKVPSLDVQEDDRTVELVSEMVKLGVPQSEARKMMKQHTADEVQNAIDYTKKRLLDKRLAKLENAAAYFRHSLVKRYAPTADVVSPINGSRPEVPKGKSVNLREAYGAKRVQEAEGYFKELDPADQEQAISRYNLVQDATVLRLTKKATKLAQASFYKWLADETWGEATAEELLEFAQSMLSG